MGGLGSIFYFFITTSLAISVPGFALTVLDTGFSIDSNAVMANHEKLSPKAWRERWAATGRALRIWLRAFLQDCMECFIQKLLDLHHVYRWRRLVGLREVDLVEVIDIAMLGVVSEKMVQGVPTDQICTH